MDIEKLIQEIMRDAEADGEPVSYDEAREMAEMEIKAKGIKRYEQAEPTQKAKAKREVKIDSQKVEILQILQKALTDSGYTAIIVNEQREIAFDDFSVTLTKHRKKK